MPGCGRAAASPVGNLEENRSAVPGRVHGKTDRFDIDLLRGDLFLPFPGEVERIEFQLGGVAVAEADPELPRRWWRRRRQAASPRESAGFRRH